MATRGIVFFDIDGTLVPSGSSSSFLAECFGHQQELDRAESLYAQGELTNQQVSEIDARGWHGASTSTVDRWLEDLPLIDGLDAVVSWCRERHVEPVLASLAWETVSAWIAERHRLTSNGGPRVGVVNATFDGTVAAHFDEYDKRDRALRLATERGLSPSQCCAVGDSRSDVPLFEALPASLALNANTAAREAATAIVDATDLRAILPWLEEWERSLG
ncbi:HAD family hydrolase [Labedella endophytica]|uniref:phosphoserine phosphatase n=1 Tax=Labedella endophytica TaxID=1523160 RepID=A0A3S0VGG9_9MICO|nr:haloacid dehalogenase-like hydrolase [Labedella endophytica]RUR01197.1 haloacid dehalogenase [Labedella endophytica]